MRKLVTRPRARRELGQIWHYIAVDSTPAADGMIARLQAAMARLCESPNLGHVRRDVQHPDYHFYTEHPYVVAYRYTRTTVTILAVVHGARDFPRLFRGV